MITCVIHKINDIMEARCVQNGNLVQYDKKWFWKSNPNENPLKGFQRVFPEHFNNEVNKLFDELCPF